VVAAGGRQFAGQHVGGDVNANIAVVPPSRFGRTAAIRPPGALCMRNQPPVCTGSATVKYAV